MAVPPETPLEKQQRSRVIWSFWVLIIALGFPTWWYTTSIYRAALPTTFMLDSQHEIWYVDEYNKLLSSIHPEVAYEIQASASRAFKPSTQYHLTVSLFTAGHAPSSWDVRKSINNYIRPILHAISATTNITVTSQIQLYSSFSSSVKPQQGEGEWRLQKEDLTSFINAAEWPLTPSVGDGPTINLIAYVPDLKYVPLLLDNSPTNSWMVPQWGGITIVNPPSEDVEGSELGRKTLPDHLDEQTLQPAFQNFQKQLLQLLGVSQSSRMPLDARLKTFQQLSALSLYSKTQQNLQSLARLSERLANIPIPKHVLHHVEFSLSALDEFRQCFGKEDLKKCSSAIREAADRSEKAFFDKSMVGQVYFPDEHKVAVYLPLLGPIGVPLVVGLLQELKSMRK